MFGKSNRYERHVRTSRKTGSLTIRFASCRGHLGNEWVWLLFSRTHLFLLQLSTCQSIASCVLKGWSRWTIVYERGSRADDQVHRLQEQDPRSLQKRSIIFMTRKNFTSTGILDGVVFAKSSPDVDLVLAHLTIFVVTSGMHLNVFRSFSFVAQNTLTRDRRHRRRRSFVRRFSSEG